MIVGFRDWARRAADFITFSSSDPTPVLHFLSPESSSGVEVNYSSAIGIAAFWRAVEVISDSMVEIPVSVMTTAADGQADTVAEGHPLQMLFEGGVNEEMDYTDFTRVTSHQLATYGNSYWKKEYMGNGDIAELIPLEPSQTRPYVTNGVKFYKGVYTNVGAVHGQPATLLAEDVVHIRGMSRTGFYGMSPIEYCRDILGLAIAAPEYGADFFNNGGVPLLALLLDEDAGAMSDKQIRDMQARWSASFGKGRHNRDRDSYTVVEGGKAGPDSSMDVSRGVKVAEGVRDIKMLTIAPNESQFLETRMENVREISRLTGVPPSKLFETSHSTYNNEAEEARAFTEDCLRPQATRIAAALTKQCLEPPYRVQFDFSGLLKPPFKERMEGYAIALDKGIYTLEQVCEMEGLPAPTEEQLQKYMGSGTMGGDMMEGNGNGMGEAGNSDGAGAGGDERSRRNGTEPVRSAF